MADELEELDPDLMFDMPEQQANGIFGQGLDDSLDFQHDGISLSASELGAGFGNIQTNGISDMHNLASPMHHAPFSLADELADAFSADDHDGTSRLLIEFEHDSEDIGRFDSLQSHPLRLAKSSRATIASQVQDDDDKHATNTAFEEETLALRTSLKEVHHFQKLLEDHNNISTNRTGDAEVRIETLASNLIRKIYDQVKLCEDGMKDLQCMKSDIQLAAAWTVPIGSVEDRSNDGYQHESQEHGESSVVADEPVIVTDTRTDTPLKETKPDLLQVTAELRVLTEGLSSSLATISEQLQVNRAAGSDSWRKLRGVETGMSRLKSELESMQVSQERIIRWEESLAPRHSAIPGLSPAPSKRSASVFRTSTASLHSSLGNQARMHLLAAQALLDDATIQAQSLLTVQ